MKEYAVCLDVVSTELTLKELTAQLGMEPSEDSHDLSSARGREGSWTVTVWRLDSGTAEAASLDAHCWSVLAKARAGNVLESIRRRKLGAYMNIAVFFDTALCTVTIPPSCLEALRDYPLGLEVTCYPSDREPGPQTP